MGGHMSPNVLGLGYSDVLVNDVLMIFFHAQLQQVQYYGEDYLRGGLRQS
jgi:hypothetical protein